MGIAFKPGTRPYRHRKQHDIMLQSDTFRRDSCAQENLRGMRFAGIRLWRRYPARVLRVRTGGETSCHLVPGYVRRHACIKGPCNSRDTNSETNRCCQEALVRRTRVPGSGAWIQYPEREHKSKTSSHGNEVPFTKCGCNMRGTQVLFWPSGQHDKGRGAGANAENGASGDSPSLEGSSGLLERMVLAAVKHLLSLHGGTVRTLASP